jgi:SAM-dependent methyltransferase
MSGMQIGFVLVDRIQRGGSASIEQADYWWYRVRSLLLETVLEPYLGESGTVLDVGSADGPSVGWLRARGRRIALDMDPRGLEKGDVCGSAMAIPFADASFDVVGAFDVIEHCESESLALAEVGRVLCPGGRLLMSVPAYQWAWTEFDEENGHYRRYTRKRAVDALESAGFDVLRATYAFTSTFPLFAAERGVRRLRRALGRRRVVEPADVVSLPTMTPAMERLLLALGRVDGRLLGSRDLPFGSSVVVAARKAS